MALPYPVPPDLRQDLKNRLRVLAASLDRRGPKIIRDSVLKMLRAFRAKASDLTEAAENVALYVAALQEFPPWAVDQAIGQFIQGLVPNRNNGFAPTVAELSDRTRAVLRGWWDERGTIVETLNAKVWREPEERTEAMKIRVQQMADTFREEATVKKREEEAEAKKRTRELMERARDQAVERSRRAAGLPPGQISAELEKMLREDTTRVPAPPVGAPE